MGQQEIGTHRRTVITAEAMRDTPPPNSVTPPAAEPTGPAHRTMPLEAVTSGMAPALDSGGGAIHTRAWSRRRWVLVGTGLFAPVVALVLPGPRRTLMATSRARISWPGSPGIGVRSLRGAEHESQQRQQAARQRLLQSAAELQREVAQRRRQQGAFRHALKPFAWGVVASAGLALLYTPQAGTATRAQVRQFGGALRDRVAQMAGQARARAGNVQDQAEQALGPARHQARELGGTLAGKGGAGGSQGQDTAATEPRPSGYVRVLGAGTAAR